MAWLLGIPLAVRLAVLALLGLASAGFVNWCVDAWAWTPRHRSPWRTHPTLTDRSWRDRLPIIGWLRLRREAGLHHRAHWVRPLAVEIGCSVALPLLYLWEVEHASLIAPAVDRDLIGGSAMLDLQGLAGWLHATFLAHAVLGLLMLVASLIDIDDRIIPDEVTVPGTLLALVLAAILPTSALPQLTFPAVAPQLGQQLELVNGKPAVVFGQSPLWIEPTHIAASSAWPAELNGAPNWRSLAIGLGCWWLWCFAFTRRRLRLSRGPTRALAVLLRRVIHDLGLFPLREITIAGTLGVVGVWYLGGNAWQGLLTALVGMIAGGGAIWLVRIFASAALGKEAMGFGDVTLMMMVGAFVGWQASVLIFFIAPFAALVLGIAQIVLGKGDALPYGPFLCLATAVTIVRWGDLWLWAEPLFAAGPLVPIVLLVCLVLCGVLLAVWGGIKRVLLSE